MVHLKVIRNGSIVWERDVDDEMGEWYSDNGSNVEVFCQEGNSIKCITKFHPREGDELVAEDDSSGEERSKPVGGLPLW